ncbi:phosphopantetheine-binding protein [Microbacter sp. GSS18]|nr:phosphopantetheine-binding protein [Microbacter sp. GSS18]
MNAQDARAAVFAALDEVAPDVDTSDLDTSWRLRQDLEIDSLDFLRLLEVLSEATGVDTPEEDYSSLSTVQQLIDYIARRG